MTNQKTKMTNHMGMTNQPKRYRLLKDLPDAEAGTKYYLNGNAYYRYQKPNGELFLLSEGKGQCIHHSIVETSPTWFSPIIEEEKPKEEAFGMTLGDIFTKEQREYVDSVRDEDLRAHLLHQVRLRDLMEADRNSFEKQLQQSKSPKQPESKDWEIVALKEESGHVYNKPINPPPYWDTLISHVHNGSTLKKIHSVKRLSDGEVFSVGDVICWDWNPLTISKYFAIERMFVDVDGKLRIVCDGTHQDFLTINKSNLRKYLNQPQ